MCGRYYYEGRTAYDIAKELGLEKEAMEMCSGDVTPGMTPVVFSAGRDGDKSKLQIGHMFWGIDGRDNKLIINTRAESVRAKPMFSGDFEYRRCIMPAEGFYEWDKDKNKVTFFRKDNSPIYLAGIYKLSQNRDSFTILTTAANSSVIRVHDRMPIIIERDKVKDWLDDYEAAKDMLLDKMPMLESRQEYEQLSFL